ncbi:hypothetical protein [Novosphingobium sp. Leaf2]|uniref:hypothetical protein n=1 Tax=Novosphingobium sp. Leaf2 TaxID=1735670 RepID=UPI000B0E4CD9|nr:hypothetical protein [Novosphingobium sp. Leaf2]
MSGAFGGERLGGVRDITTEKPTPDASVKTHQIFASADNAIFRRSLVDAKPVNFASWTRKVRGKQALLR